MRRARRQKPVGHPLGRSDNRCAHPQLHVAIGTLGGPRPRHRPFPVGHPDRPQLGGRRRFRQCVLCRAARLDCGCLGCRPGSRGAPRRVGLALVRPRADVSARPRCLPRRHGRHRPASGRIGALGRPLHGRAGRRRRDDGRVLRRIGRGARRRSSESRPRQNRSRQSPLVDAGDARRPAQRPRPWTFPRC